MTEGLLLDTHTLIWLEQRNQLHAAAIFPIARARLQRRLFVSEISFWELGTLMHRKRLERRPDLRGLSIREWVAGVGQRYALQFLPVTTDIALEAANVPAVYGSGDPGDCFLIATARVHAPHPCNPRRSHAQPHSRATGVSPNASLLTSFTGKISHQEDPSCTASFSPPPPCSPSP